MDDFLNFTAITSCALLACYYVNKIAGMTGNCAARVTQYKLTKCIYPPPFVKQVKSLVICANKARCLLLSHAGIIFGLFLINPHRRPFMAIYCHISRNRNF